MSVSAPTVLLDLTPWQTMHRLRGIGRYVYDLAAGLGTVARGDDGGSKLRVLGVAWIDGRGRGTILEDLSALTDVMPRERLADADARVRWRRRIYLGRVARHVGACAVHVPDARGTPLGSIPRIVTCHDLIPLRFPERYLDWKDGGALLRRARDARRYRGAACVIAISEETRRDLVSLLAVDPLRINVVHNGIDLGRWSTEPTEKGRALLARRGLAANPYLLYVGGLEWRKNADTMLAAIAHASTTTTIDLAWAGRLDDSEIARLTALAQAHGVGERLKLLGFVDDAELAVLYRRSLAHLFVSRAEGFGLTLVEAMACGAPVIATAGSSLAEVAGDAALLVDPEEASAIAAAALRLLHDRALRVELRTRGAERAQVFSHVAFARRTLDVYRGAARSTVNVRTGESAP